MKLLDIISEEVIIKGTNVWNHIVNITPDKEMIPHGFEKLIVNRDFKLVKDYDVSQLLKTDISFKEYYDSGEDRYEDDDDFDPSGIDEPIVVVDGELLDGYSRATASLRYDYGKKDAYVAIEKSKGEDTTLEENLNQTKIVDDKGEPLIVYRSQEDDRKQGIDRQSNTKGIYFSANPESTKIYGNITKEYYLNIKNPIVLKDKEWNLSVMPGYLYDMLVKKGYDGAVWLRQGEMYEIIAFYPHQIIPINNKDTNIDMKGQESIDEDLNKWFKEKWVNIGKKVDGKHPPCGTSGEKKGYAKCVPAAKAASMSKKEKENATKRKRSAQNRAGRGGKDSPGQGKTPIYVSTKPKNEQMNLEEKLNLFLERNCPNSPGKWAASKAAAKSKFDVYPSAYANGWAAKNYKSKGGTWRKCNEGDMNGLYEGEISQDDQREMIEGIAEIVKGVKDIENRKELAKKQIKQLQSEGINFDVKEFLSMCGFKSKIKEEEIDEYDVELDEEVRDFAQYIKEYVKQLSESELTEAEYRGHKVPLGKPMQGDVKKFKVYVKNPAGRVVKVNFGDPNMKIKKSNPKRRKSFRARHHCDTNPGPRTKARYWSCRKW